MCLIRDDLTTLWCEVTSSIRSGTVEDENCDEKSNLNLDESGEVVTAPKQEQKEVLLCLRPIRDGDKVDESLRFTPLTRDEGSMPLESLKDQMVSSTSGSGGNTLDDKADSDKASSTTPSNQSTSRASGSSSNDMNKKRPPKKRLLSATSMGTLSNSNEESPKKRPKTDSKGQSSGNSSDTEKSVVESLMLMNKAKSSQ